MKRVVYYLVVCSFMFSLGYGLLSDRYFVAGLSLIGIMACLYWQRQLRGE